MLNNRTADFLTTLETARTLGDLWSTTGAYLDSLGFTHSVYTFVDPGDPGAARIWTSLPDAWCTRYADENYWRVDPYYRYCCRTFAPIRTGPDYLDDYDFLTGLNGVSYTRAARRVSGPASRRRFGCLAVAVSADGTSVPLFAGEISKRLSRSTDATCA